MYRRKHRTKSDEECFRSHKEALQEALADTPHSLLWFDLGDCDRRRHNDGGLALVLFVCDDGGAYLVLVQADVSSCTYPWKPPLMTSLPPDPKTIPYYFEDWTTASRLTSLFLNLSANVASSTTLHRLFPLSHSVQLVPPAPCTGFSQVFYGPLVSKADDLYGFASLWYSYETSASIILVSNGEEWIGVPSARGLRSTFPPHFPYDQVVTKDRGYTPF